MFNYDVSPGNKRIMADEQPAPKPKRKRVRKPKAKQNAPAPTPKPGNKSKKRGPRKSKKALTTTDFPGVIDYEVSRPRGNGRMRHSLGVARGIPLAASEFIHRHCNPCGEMVTLTEHSKVPDGALPNSAVLELREVFIVRPPPAGGGVPATGSVPLDGSLWTLTAIHTPMFRHPLILIASLQNAEMTEQDRDQLRFLWNHRAPYPRYPIWGELYPEAEAGVFWCVVDWSGLRNVATPDGEGATTEIEQYRITADGITCFNNTPDLINQGMLTAAQWNVNKGVKVTAPPEELDNIVVAAGVYSYNQLFNGVTRNFLAVQIPLNNFGETTIDPAGANGLAVARTGQYNYPAFAIPTLNATTNAHPVTFAVVYNFTVAQNVQVGSISVASGAVLSLGMTRSAQNGPVAISLYNADGQTLWDTTLTSAQLASNIWPNAVDVNLEVIVDEVNNVQLSTFELPPTSSEAIMQSTPKAVYMSMKEQNGWYMVKRVWQPIFNVQNANTYRYTYMAGAGQEMVSETPFPEQDTFDLNYGMGVVVMSSIPTSCCPAFKLMRDVEIVAGQNSAWQLFMKSNGDPYKGAVEVAHSIAIHHPFCYPESYNILGGLMNLITGALGKLPIIGDVVNAVGHVVGGLTKQETANSPPSGQSQNRLCSTNTDELAKTLSMLLGQLGVGK